MLKLPPNYWAVIFRILWLLGYSKHSESYKEATLRASAAAAKLIELARQHGQMLFVGHGIFNRLVAKALRKQGWVGPKSPGYGYWSVAVYQRTAT